jgi:hypothetical protein
LHDDAFDCALRGVEIGDRRDVRPSKAGLVGLMERGADEECVRAQLLDEVREPAFDGAIEMALCLELLTPRNDVLGAH